MNKVLLCFVIIRIIFVFFIILTSCSFTALVDNTIFFSNICLKFFFYKRSNIMLVDDSVDFKGCVISCFFYFYKRLNIVFVNDSADLKVTCHKQSDVFVRVSHMSQFKSNVRFKFILLSPSQ